MENSLTLYEIKNKYLELAFQDEITEEEKAELREAIHNELLQKSEGIIAVTKQAELMIEATKTEEERLKANRKANEKKLEDFKEYVKNCMMQMGVSKIETPLGEIKVAKNPMSVEITNEELIPDEYKRTKVETSLDKKSLLDNFKATGELINGAVFHDDRFSLRIK